MAVLPEGAPFKASEFECRCGCGLGLKDMPQSTIDKLVKARAIAKVPFIIDSAIRCATHNANERGARNSAHLRGYALDVRARDSRTRYKILTALLAAGFTRLGYNKKFIHADDDPSLDQEVIFDY